MSTNRLYYAYARHALVTALKLVRVQAGSSVLVPDFICRDVLASLHAVGANPVFYPIGDDLQMATTQSLPSAQAIIVVNFFGFPADLRGARNFVSAHTAIIEDNAHGWLSVDRDGTPLGSRADAGITSVRKTIRLPDGAYVEWRAAAHLDTNALHAPLTPRNEALPFGFRLRHVVARIDSVSPVSVM
ncbi:MAG: DegT/DnrJ/EryC1/StrS family aminotransferase, partial [Ilumatobacteraceae bacterium]